MASTDTPNPLLRCPFRIQLDSVISLRCRLRDRHNGTHEWGSDDGVVTVEWSAEAEQRLSIMTGGRL